jgi:hypothetical protein
VENVIQATENFIHKAGEIAHENPDMRNDLLQSMEEVKRTGTQKKPQSISLYILFLIS